MADIIHLNADETPFSGKTPDPDAAAKLDIIRRSLKALEGDPFLDGAKIADDPSSPNAQVILDFPTVITFSGAKKSFLPAILNAADAYTVIRTEAGFRVVATILNYWKED